MSQVGPGLEKKAKLGLFRWEWGGRTLLWEAIGRVGKRVSRAVWLDSDLKTTANMAGRKGSRRHIQREETFAEET